MLSFNHSYLRMTKIIRAMHKQIDRHWYYIITFTYLDIIKNITKKPFVNRWLFSQNLKKFILLIDINGKCAKHAQLVSSITTCLILRILEPRKNKQNSLDRRRNKNTWFKHSLCKSNALHPNHFVHNKLCTKYTLKSSSSWSPTTFSFSLCFLPCLKWITHRNLFYMSP